MRVILILFFGLYTITSLAQTPPVPGAYNVGVIRSKVLAADTANAKITATNYGAVFFNSAQNKFRICYSGTCYDLAVSGGGGSVISVSGTTNRITSTGGTTPSIDISAVFEATLGKVANPLSQFASTTSGQLRGTLSDELGIGAALFDGATPTSLILNNATGLPITGVTGMGTGVSTFLITPSWTNFNSMITGTSSFWSIVNGATLGGNNTIAQGSNYINYTGSQTGTNPLIFSSYSINASTNSQQVIARDHTDTYSNGGFTNTSYVSNRWRSGRFAINVGNSTVESTLQVNGESTASTDYAFILKNSSTYMLRFGNDGHGRMGNNGTPISYGPGDYATGNVNNATGGAWRFQAINGFVFTNGTGNGGGIKLMGTSSAISSTATDYGFNDVRTINYTGGVQTSWGYYDGRVYSGSVPNNFYGAYFQGKSGFGPNTSTPIAVLEVAGNIGEKVNTITASSVTLDNTYRNVLANSASNSITVNLPAAASAYNSTAGTSFVYTVVKTSVLNTVTIDPNGAEQINGVSTYVVTGSTTIITDGTAWYIKAN